MQKTHALCGTATVGMALIFTGGATAQTASKPLSAKTIAPATAWAKSVKIMAVPVSETDESQLLGLKMWRFVVTAPKPVHQVKALIEVQEQGKPSRLLLSQPMNPQMGWPMNKQFTFFVGQYMPSGGRLEAIDKVKYQLRISGFRPAPLTEFGGSTAEEIEMNPFSGIGGWEIFSGPEQRPDGSFVLMSGNKAASFAPNTPPDVALVFRVEEEAY